MSQIIQLQLGDCMERLKELNDSSIDAFISDPPYDLTQASRKGSPRHNNPNTPFGRTRLGSHDQIKKSGGFMGKSWDATGIAFDPEFWGLVYRKLKSGGVIKAFSGTRTYHKMVKAMKTAGFIELHIKAWTYSSGFPKSSNIFKMIQRHNKKASTKLPIDVVPWKGYGTGLKPSWEPIVVGKKP